MGKTVSELATLSDDASLWRFGESRRLPIDRWLANSLLQKAIRRGASELASAAARTLYDANPAAVWRRLTGIAFEDIGIASPDTVVAVTCACRDGQWRAQMGGPDLVLTALARALAQATKDRSADYLVCAAQKHPAFGDLRDVLKRVPLETRLKVVSNPASTLIQRAIATWLSSGIHARYDRPPSDFSLTDLLSAFRAAGVPEAIAAATGIAAKHTREPIVLMVGPLLLEILLVPSSTDTTSQSIPETLGPCGIPLYAVDQHTRLGHQAFARVLRQNAAVRAVFGEVPSKARLRALGVAAFYVDGAPLSRRMNWARSTELEALGIEADLLPLGVAVDTIPSLIETVKANIDDLNQIRAKLLAGLVERDA